MPSGSVNFGAVALSQQAELAWCYAQVCSIVSRHVGGAAGWSPCQIVARNLSVKLNSPLGGGCNCCAKAKPAACTGAFAVGKMAATLDALNVTYSVGDGMPTSARIQAEINANRPVALAFVRADGSAGHVGMIVGYDDAPRPGDADRTDMLTLYDPAITNVPIFNGRANLINATVQLTFGELYAKYPTAKYSVGKHYYNFGVAAAGIPAAPAWAVFVP